MNSAVLKALLLLLVPAITSATRLGGTHSMLLMDPEVPHNQCRYWRAHNLFQVQCKGMELEKIPNNLQKSIEVLDARKNRIRELGNETLTRYTSLHYLYLQDNFITRVGSQAFEPTDSLEVLDLTTNGLREIPKSLFQLPYLRNLYLNNNELQDSQLEVSNVQSPLVWLHVAQNQLTKLPQLSPLSWVRVLNVSRNSIRSISVDDIAPLCSLQELDISGNPISFNQSSCECHQFMEWVKLRNIKLYNMQNLNSECSIVMRERCPSQDFSNQTMALYSSCMTIVQDRIEAKKARTTWIWIASCIGAFVGCIFIALCCMHSRNRDKRQRFKEQAMLESSNANTEQLLNKENLKNEHA